jgi:hypothetical protein
MRATKPQVGLRQVKNSASVRQCSNEARLYSSSLLESAKSEPRAQSSALVRVKVLDDKECSDNCDSECDNSILAN